MPVTLIVMLLCVEIFNFGIYVFASILLYYEYVRKVSEAWYSHKLFINLNLVCHVAHVALFYEMYSGALIYIGISRCMVFFGISITQCLS